MEKKIYFCPCDFPELSDTAAIQRAVDMAAKTDIRTVVIPARETPWELEESVYLPDFVTVILLGCKIYTKGIAFLNASAEDESTKNLGGEQQGISLLGYGNAKIVGSEKPQIYFSNVQNYRIFGITCEGGAGIRLFHVREGKVQQLRFLGSRYGLFFGECSNNNLIEDILAETKEEAVIWSGGDSAIWGRRADIYDSSLCRLEARTGGAPAVTVSANAVGVNNLFLRDITDRTEADGVSIWLGEAGGQELLDISVRGVASRRKAVFVGGSCDGIYLGNLQGNTAEVSSEATRILQEDAAEEITIPQFAEIRDRQYIFANDPSYFGESDAQTIQNAVNAAAASEAALIIPRYNARTDTLRWDIDKTVELPSDCTVILLDAHLRQTDFTYCNLFANAQVTAQNIRVAGVGSAVLDSGIPNGLKVKNAGKLGFGSIGDNATIRFSGVDGLQIENLHIDQSRWYSIYCTDCSNGHIANIDLYAPPVFPDLGGVLLGGGCKDFLIENMTGLSGEDMVALQTAGLVGLSDGQRMDADICNVHIRTIKANPSRCFLVSLSSRKGYKLHDIQIENLLDCSVPEQKKQPRASVRIGQIEDEGIYDITIRDVNGRGAATIELGGSSDHVSISNIHSYGGSEYTIRTATNGECYDYYLMGMSYELSKQPEFVSAKLEDYCIKGLFFRCQQASRYMRGTATSIITDKKKYIGTVLDLEGVWSKKLILADILTDRIGRGVYLTGKANAEVRNFQAAEVGRETAICGSHCSLIVNGQKMPVTESISL